MNMESFSQMSPESKIETVSELWANPDYVTVSFRRHSVYTGPVDKIPSRTGALNHGGIDKGRESAKKWKEQVDKIPGEKRLIMRQSPSYFIATRAQSEKENDDGTKVIPERTILPQRTAQTASLYEKEVFGKLEPGRRQFDDLLGDFFEHTTPEKSKLIPAFMKLRAQHYGGKMPQFWKDYNEGELPEDLRMALPPAGGSESKELAQNVRQFLVGVKNGFKKDGKKEIELALSHGETEEAFLELLSEKLRARTKKENFEIPDMDYNQGFDVHVGKNGTIFVTADFLKTPLKFTIEELKVNK
ncbi:MAG: hypothetical protein HY225_00735 [Candidatus Vogelbacteria bacterium]|nr:hypothetical protein [Candidatus Vogelbacteria bacterium]